MTGIGLLTAYTIIAEVGEIGRFRSENAFSSYCGLVLSTRQSADKVYHGRIGPAGRRTLKWAFVEAAHTAVKRDSYFSSIYHKHNKSKGDGKKVRSKEREVPGSARTPLWRTEAMLPSVAPFRNWVTSD